MTFLAPLLRSLDQRLDRRLVSTFLATLIASLTWLGLLILGRTGAPRVAARQWWSKRGERASDQQTQLVQLLKRSITVWGRDIRQLWDREFASGP
jgi:hypothetical protein